MPDPVARYLDDVYRLLPIELRDEIVDELAETITARIDGIECELRRSLDHDETRAILGDFGTPRRLAARYHPKRALVGAMLAFLDRGKPGAYRAGAPGLVESSR